MLITKYDEVTIGLNVDDMKALESGYAMKYKMVPTKNISSSLLAQCLCFQKSCSAINMIKIWVCVLTNLHDVILPLVGVD